ncbi:MAG TPA: hypothetical protein VK932_30225, partial [Kofleriaceae bacterium]|nr:hypothetical protein [Kofleriaceae bacterium]
MTKRDDDSPADLEVGMTTAERRRRRRRGGGLRVPSDNVPRRPSPPVVAPVPEDPSLAMSIAYSYTSDASEPVPTVPPEEVGYPDPSGGAPMAAVIDSVSGPVDQADFEMKTREMAAVDLEELGLAEIGGAMAGAGGAGSDGAAQRGELPGGEARHRPAERSARGGGRPDSNEELAVELADVEEPTAIASPPPPQAPAEPAYRGRERLRTVALSDEDLEEVREAVRAMEAAPIAAAAAPIATPHAAAPTAAPHPAAPTAAPHPAPVQGVVAGPMQISPSSSTRLPPLASTSGAMPTPPLASTSGAMPTPLAQAQAQAPLTP